MLNRLLGIVFMNIYSRFFKTRVRRGSLQGVRGYLKAVEFLRAGLMGIAALGSAVAAFVAGLVLLAIGLLSMAPIAPRTMALTVVGIGLLLAIVSGVILAMVFNQRRWLEQSRSYELMDAVLSPWPNAIPPNPVDVIKGRKEVTEAETEFESAKMARELAESSSMQPRTPMVPQ